MYTYNPRWGLSLVASRGQAERLSGAHTSFSLCFWFVLYSAFVYSFIHSSVAFSLPFSLSFSSSQGASGRDGRETVFVKKKDFSTFFPSLFHFVPGIPVPSFYSLRSFVIFGSVRHFGVCLGNRVEGPLRIVVRGSGDTWEGACMDEKGWWQRGKGDKVTRWHGLKWI